MDVVKYLFTEDDEALCLVAFDNNVKKWKEEAKQTLRNASVFSNDLRHIKLSEEEKMTLPIPKFTMS